MGLEDVPSSFEACAKLIEDLEARNMAPSEDNARIAEGVFALYASTIPQPLTPVVKAVLVAFMDSRLRIAFNLPALLSSVIHTLLAALLAVREYFVRHLMLPRYSNLQVFGEENAVGYRSMSFWEIEPWYVAASSKSCSWVYMAYTRFFDLPVVGDARFRPGGYKLHEIGPKHFEGKGGEEVMIFVKENRGCAFTTFGQFSGAVYTRAGCPAMSPAKDAGV